MKKNKTYIWVSLIVLVFGIYAVPKIIDRIQNGEIVKGGRLYVVKSDDSVESDLFQVGTAPRFNLTNQEGKVINNDFYKGKVYLVEFFFTTCPTICPVMNKNMVAIDKMYQPNPNFGIVSITINPKNDTPEVLKEYAKTHEITNKNWNFLTGDESEIFDLSNKGFNLYAGMNSKIAGGFEHSGLFALIDKKGNIRCRMDEFGNPIVYYDGIDKKAVEMLKLDIKKLLAE
ncbi:MAG: SCO family protein [Flavobacterium sp.]